MYEGWRQFVFLSRDGLSDSSGGLGLMQCTSCRRRLSRLLAAIFSYERDPAFTRTVDSGTNSVSCSGTEEGSLIKSRFGPEGNGHLHLFPHSAKRSTASP